MNSEAKDFLKKHGVLIVGAIIGLYVLVKYYKGSGSSASSSSASPLAAQAAYATQMQALGLQASAQQAQQQLQTAALNDQTSVAMAAQQTNYTQAVGSTAKDAAGGIASVISAQSMIPAMAINAASQNNQATLADTAAATVAGYQSLPGAINAGANAITASYVPQISYGATVSGISNSLANGIPASLNSLAQTGSSATSGAANAAASGAAANASGTSSTMQTVGSVAGVAAMMML